MCAVFDVSNNVTAYDKNGMKRKKVLPLMEFRRFCSVNIS